MNENIDVPRNGHAVETWQYLKHVVDTEGNITKEPYDLTGMTITATARDIAGGSVLASATIAVTFATSGIFTTQWFGANFDTYGEVQALAKASYDIKIARGDGVIDVPVRGHLNIIPECTA